MAKREGWHGWDTYAAFYDWENARTLGRRDVAFWRRTLREEQARTLELLSLIHISEPTRPY